MLIDGVFVIANGKYIGPEKPGPWSNIFGAFGIDVFKLGPMFVLWGVAWLIFVAGLLTEQSWAFWFGMVVAILTLWYLPVGTLLSLIVLGGLWFGLRQSS